MPELRHLRAFLAVAEQRNFTRAAEQLNVAQQAVSKSVQTLEGELGVELLRRTTHDVQLTAAGEGLQRSGRDALRRIDAAFEAARDHGRGVGGVVRVGVTPAVGTAMHPRIAAALTEGASKLRVAFRELRSPEAVARLRDEQLDLVVSRAAPADERFASAELPGSPAVVLVSAAHELAGRGRIEASELDGGRLQAWNGPGDAYAEDLLDRLRQVGAEVELAVAQVMGGSGPPVLDATEFALRPAGWPVGDLVALDLEPPGLTLPLWVQWPVIDAHPGIRRLREHL